MTIVLTQDWLIDKWSLFGPPLMTMNPCLSLQLPITLVLHEIAFSDATLPYRIAF